MVVSSTNGPEVRENTLSRADAVTRPYTLPKHVFKLYKSAEVHTVQEKRKPLAFYASVLALVVCLLFGISLYIKFRVVLTLSLN